MLVGRTGSRSGRKEGRTETEGASPLRHSSLIIVLSPPPHLPLTTLVHTKFRSITLVATQVHVILWSFVVLIWMCDTIGLV